MANMIEFKGSLYNKNEISGIIKDVYDHRDWRDDIYKTDYQIKVYVRGELIETYNYSDTRGKMFYMEERGGLTCKQYARKRRDEDFEILKKLIMD